MKPYAYEKSTRELLRDLSDHDVEIITEALGDAIAYRMPDGQDIDPDDTAQARVYEALATRLGIVILY